MKRWPFLIITPLIIFTALNNRSYAQIKPDTSLPNNSVVSKQGNLYTITEGTIAGQNLFHSFESFSIPPGAIADFAQSVPIENIISRVTGKAISDIQGTLRSASAANFFLLNPNGIVFGPNARLEVGGAFVASTASGLKFADQTEFRADQGDQPSLLTVSTPIGLQFGQQVGTIANAARNINPVFNYPSGLEVLPGRTLALVGGDVMLTGNLWAAGGNLEVGAVDRGSYVGLEASPFGYQLDFSQVQNFRDVVMQNQARLDATGPGAGRIAVHGDQVILRERSAITAYTIGDLDGVGIDIKASDLKLQDKSFISALTRLGAGDAGDISIQADSIELLGAGNLLERIRSLLEARPQDAIPQDAIASEEGTSPGDVFDDGILTLSLGEGNSGNLTITTGKLFVNNGAAILTSTYGTGQGGNLTINAAAAVQVNDAILATGTDGPGKAGDIVITTKDLSLNGGYMVAITLDQGRGGDIEINAESISLRTTTELTSETIRGLALAIGLSTIVTETISEGDAGSLTINTRDLVVSGGSQINTINYFGTGNSGDITVNADLVYLAGTSKNPITILGVPSPAPSALSSSTLAEGNAGTLRVTTKRLVLKDGGDISSFSRGAGNAGSIIITALESIEVMGQCDCSPLKVASSIRAGAPFYSPAYPIPPTGDAGSIIITTPRLLVQDGGEIGVNNEGTGDAGSLIIVAPLIQLIDGGKLTAEVQAGQFGNIEVYSENLQLRRGSQITTNAAQETSGGNIFITTNLLTALENSDISANSRGGPGGRVRIAAQAIFGTAPRRELTDRSDITASSALGPEFDGQVELTILERDPGRGLFATLPILQDIPPVEEGCRSGTSRYHNTGWGGLPPDVGGTLPSMGGWSDPVVPIAPAPPPQAMILPSITEGTHWQVNARGQVELVGASPFNPRIDPQEPFENLPNPCPTSHPT